MKQALLLLSCPDIDINACHISADCSLLESVVFTSETSIILTVIRRGHSKFCKAHVLSALIAMDHFCGTTHDKHQLIKLLLAELPPSELEPNLECQFAALMLPHDDLTRRLIVQSQRSREARYQHREEAKLAFDYLSML